MIGPVPNGHAAVWASIDRLMALECRSINAGTLRPLYGAARERVGSPLCEAAARRLVAAVGPRAAVVLTTGAGGPTAATRRRAAASQSGEPTRSRAAP